MQLPPSFERAGQGIQSSFQSAEAALVRGFHSVGAEVQAVEARVAGAVRPNTAPHKPNFQPVSGQPAPASSMHMPSMHMPASVKKFEKSVSMNFTALYIEPGNTALYVMVAAGLMMMFACEMPFYLGVCLLWDAHYRTWVGYAFPLLVVFISIFMPLAFVGAIYVIMQRGHGAGVRSEENMVLVGATFTSLLGILLCLLALPMSTSAAGTVSRLSFGCDLADPISAPLIQYSQVLHNIRNTPECQVKNSIKDCTGYKSNKYVDYLHRLERDFECTGLCTLPAPPTAIPESAQPKVAEHANAGEVPTSGGQGVASGPQKLLGVSFLEQQSSRALSTSNKTMSGLSTQSRVFTSNSNKIPALMLFTEDRTDQRCYPLIADRLQVISGTTGELLFWQGIGLLFVSVIAGATKVVDKTLFEK